MGTTSMGHCHMEIGQKRDSSMEVGNKQDSCHLRTPDGTELEGSLTAGGNKIVRDRKPQLASDGPPLVAFKKVEYLCFEDVGAIQITVVRRYGNDTPAGDGSSTVHWRTANMNTIPESYIDLEGTLVFEPGDVEKTFSMQILDNDVWNMEASQMVHLHSPEDCVLGGLAITTIVCLNEDYFPSGIDIQDSTNSQFVDEDGLPDHNRIVEEMEDSNKVIKTFVNHMRHYFPLETRWGMIYKLYPAVSWLCLKLILLLLLNNILPSENEVHLWFVAAAFVANLLLENIVAERYNELRIGGKARGLLRTALLDVSSQLQLKEQEQFPGGEVSNIMGAGVETVVSMVWGNFFNLVQDLMLLIVMVGLMMYTLHGIIWMAVFPIIMIAIDICINFRRSPSQSALYQKYLNAENVWKANVMENVEQRTCITTFNAGTQTCASFKAIHQRSNGANWQQGTFLMRTQWFVKWNHTLLTAFVMIYTGKRVMDGEMELGDFTVLISTLFQFGGQVLSIITSLSQMANGYMAVNQLSELLNCPTRRKALLRSEQRQRVLLKEFMEQDPDFNPNLITFAGVEYHYNKQVWVEESETALQAEWVEQQVRGFGPVTLMFEQGQVLAVEAGHRGGKQTMIQLLGQLLLPTRGFIWYPENLRVRFLSDQPMLFDKSIFANLRFGNNK